MLKVSDLTRLRTVHNSGGHFFILDDDMIPSEIKEDALGETKESLGIQNQHFCKECNISFNKGKSLETYVDYFHKEMTCEIYQVTVGSKYNLIRNKEVHQQNKVKCEHCDLILSRKCLKRHINRLCMN